MPKPTRRAPALHPKQEAFDEIALLLQGGGALGAYQAGAYEALQEAGVELTWVAGVSIGAINCAIIAGNPPERRVPRLRQFWENITTDYLFDEFQEAAPVFFNGDMPQSAFANFSSALTALGGQKGFFQPRFPPPWCHFPGSLGATSFYDTAPLRHMLQEIIDFDLLNRNHMHFSVGAVNVRSGNYVYFDNRRYTITPDHVMASAALPPGFPAVEIEGELYWDGGVVSNTPLQWLLDQYPRRNTLAFQVDLWSARGGFPRDLGDVYSREREIRFSSRTRLNTDQVRKEREFQHAVNMLLEKLPANLQQDPIVQQLKPLAETKYFNIVHLIYRSRSYETPHKDYEFSRAGMKFHWAEGRNDVCRALRHGDIFDPPEAPECVRIFDLSRDDRG